MVLAEGLTSQQPWWSQPPECFPPHPSRFSGVFLSLPNVGWENARARAGSLPSHKLYCGCPLIRCVSTRLAVFAGYRRASRPTLSRSPSMRHCTSASSHRHPPLVPAPWTFHLRYSGDWLNGVPSAALGLLLHDREFRSCLRY